MTAAGCTFPIGSCASEWNEVLTRGPQCESWVRDWMQCTLTHPTQCSPNNANSACDLQLTFLRECREGREWPYANCNQLVQLCQTCMYEPLTLCVHDLALLRSEAGPACEASYLAYIACEEAHPVECVDQWGLICETERDALGACMRGS
jgi:hypothetical protein